MGLKGHGVIGANGRFDWLIIGEQTWTMVYEPSTVETYVDSEFKVLFGKNELTIASGDIRKVGTEYHVDVKPVHLSGQFQGKYSVYGLEGFPEAHIGYGKWYRKTVK